MVVIVIVARLIQPGATMPRTSHTVRVGMSQARASSAPALAPAKSELDGDKIHAAVPSCLACLFINAKGNAKAERDLHRLMLRGCGCSGLGCASKQSTAPSAAAAPVE